MVIYYINKSDSGYDGMLIDEAETLESFLDSFGLDHLQPQRETVQINEPSGGGTSRSFSVDWYDDLGIIVDSHVYHPEDPPTK